PCPVASRDTRPSASDLSRAGSAAREELLVPTYPWCRRQARPGTTSRMADGLTVSVSPVYRCDRRDAYARAEERLRTGTGQRSDGGALRAPAAGPAGVPGGAQIEIAIAGGRIPASVLPARRREASRETARGRREPARVKSRQRSAGHVVDDAGAGRCGLARPAQDRRRFPRDLLAGDLAGLRERPFVGG